MEGRSIKLDIAGNVYSLKAQSPESEQLMRLAAESINQMLAKYDQKFPGKSPIDKLAFVTLNETVGRISAQRNENRTLAEIEKLNAELGSYLDKIDSNR